ncbi:hypothetical protein ANCDUO_16482 [Ancylostoma duodenale]|uniref:DUF7596 domain-containing protein n=1 Tax=Ancylostoma duodenale TaxID=51022 RepID=A0A0C2CAT5_9BILA|nr:hypothetical protein ANCDUO_16482 [Ancylostoma duodenale]
MSVDKRGYTCSSTCHLDPVVDQRHCHNSLVWPSAIWAKPLKSMTEKENRRLLPLYVQFHTVPEARPAEAHLVDRLAEHALGRFNLELKKNVTHDSFVESDSWRDEAGFIVTDRNRFVYVTFKTSALLPTLTPAVVK